MASAVHAGSPVYPVAPSFSQSSTESAMNGISNSQSGLTSFDGAPSIASTPTPTPPASRQQHGMPYGMPNYSSTNGSFSQSSTPRHSQKMPAQQNHSTCPKPQIYTAVYSGVSVYEMEVGGVAVMRRRSDSWLNATQILKVAGVEKGKRTKVLEKEILSGQHEKVQGGYGRYQGTWITYTRGVEFSRQYGVEETLRPLFEYDMGQDGVSMAGQGDLHTPTKEQAMAAQRKRNLTNGGIENRQPTQSSNGTFFKNISKSAANAVNAISKARFDSPNRSGINGRPAKLDRKSSQQMLGSQDSAYIGSSQQSMQSMQSLHSESSFGANGQTGPSLRSFGDAQASTLEDSGDVREPPRKRAKQESFAYNDTATFDTSMHDISDLAGTQNHVSDFTYGLQPLPQPASHSAIEKQQMLTSLFLDANQTDFSTHPAFLNLSGEDLDIPIDATAHTALHWAATLARTPLLRTLIRKGASIYRLNGGGESALIRAAITTNNLDQSSFPELLELLGPTIEIRDGRGRTVLHHIAVSSAVKGRGSACRYYLESLLEFIVRQGSAPSSQQNSFQDPSVTPHPKPIGLARFMSEIVNATDISGDTALNLAARIGNKSIIQQLLEVGANPTIPNRGGLRPVDFGVGGEPTDTLPMEPNNQLAKSQRNSMSKVNESSQELLTSISTLLSDTESSFRAEIQTKQSLVDQAHTKLREATSSLTDERRHLTDIRRVADQKKAFHQCIANLYRVNDAQEVVLVSNHPDKSRIRTDVRIGEADAGLEVDESALDLEDRPQPLTALTPSQQNYLSSLPATTVLRARATAYKNITTNLEHQAKGLQSQSSDLEAQLRKVIVLCTGVDEAKVDEIVEGLVQAVESERGEDVEIGRVREFLRKVADVV